MTLAGLLDAGVPLTTITCEGFREPYGVSADSETSGRLSCCGGVEC